MRSFDLEATRRALDAAATTSTSLCAYREAVLDALAMFVSFDGAFFHALSPRVSLETGVLRGLDPHALARSVANWDEMSVELGALRMRANEKLAVADDEIYPLGSKRRARFERQVVRRFGMSSLCMVHLVVRSAVHAAIVMFARRHRAFSPAAVAALRALAPSIAIGDTLHTLMDGTARASAPTQLVCTDQRLTPRQRQIVDLVALGHTNLEIGTALGLSPHTTRNHLARIFARLGAANRAEVLRLAVSSPSLAGARI